MIHDRICSVILSHNTCHIVACYIAACIATRHSPVVSTRYTSRISIRYRSLYITLSIAINDSSGRISDYRTSITLALDKTLRYPAL